MTQDSQNINVRAGKNRWFTQLYLILFFQSVLFFSIAITIYSIYTFNLYLLLFLVLVVILQKFLKRSKLVIKFVQDKIHQLWYFDSFKRIYEQPVKQTSSLFAMHPHSILAYCLPANMNADNSIMSQMSGLASRFLLHLPFVGIVLRLWGMNSVNPENMKKLMQQKKPIGLLPGGFEEATITSPNQLRVYIKNRKGFIKYALNHNYTIYPTLTYNEHKAFWTFDYFTQKRLWLNKLKFPAVIFGGGFLWLYLPLNLEIVTIVGRGIKRDGSKIGLPITNEQIDKVHQNYMEQLKRIHQKYKDQFKESQLVIY